jgi:rhamnogalacturonyl hydrolase YesR
LRYVADVGAADASALVYATCWAEHYDYQLYTRSEAQAGVRLPPGKHIADHQLCAATYIELWKLDGNASHLTDVKAVLGEEIAASQATSNYWSWVDALFMAMSVYSRLGNVTSDPSYAAKQWVNFNASALMRICCHMAAFARPVSSKTGPLMWILTELMRSSTVKLAAMDAKNRGVAEGDGATFGFWNGSDSLFYRDDSFVYSRVYWGRGNGWAISALVAAIEHGEPSDPHRAEYTLVFTQLAAELLQLQGSDGAWRASLLNVSGYPLPETTGTASFAYGLAWGVNAGLLPASTYLPTVTKAWAWLSTVALHADGLVGNCQPGGGSPENNFNASSTSNFCVGQFLLAASQVSRLAASQ